MRKTFLVVLLFVSILAIVVRVSTKPLEQVLGIKQRAGLRVESNQDAKAFLNSRELGKTPYQNEDLTEGEYLVELKPASEGSQSAFVSWKGYVKLIGGTLTVVNRDFSTNTQNSSGEIINLEKGSGVTIVSSPDSADVMVDGLSQGRTPVVIANIGSGEHQFLVSHDNYLKRSIRATVAEGYALVLNVDLSLAEVDLASITTSPITSQREVVIKLTPTGFLRVRSAPSTTAKEIARVKPGERLPLIEDLPSWIKIKTVDGQEGYVSAAYVDKNTPSLRP